MHRSARLILALAAAALIGAEPPQATSNPPICHAAADPSVPSAAVSILTGYGDGGFPILTRSAEAQAYFNNGMQLGHAFAHDASISAFKKAEQLDPTCAMCLWGEAWARGPTINYSIDKTKQADLAALADKAAVLGSSNPPTERALIGALQKRYHNGGGGGRGDIAFATALDSLLRADDQNLELAVLTADAWMIPAADGDNRDHLDRAMSILESALARAPNNTGAIHFYIHASEMTGVGVKALPYAEKLQALAPSASHLVHMPSHTYFWAGRYRMAEQSNLDAVKIDEGDALRLKTKGGVFGLNYHGHNVQFGEGSALMDGDGSGGMALASSEVEHAPSLKVGEPYEQVALGTAYSVYGRYGSQAQIAALAEPSDTLPYARALWRYARGEAAARRGNAPAVRLEAAAVVLKRSDLKAFGDLSGPAGALVEVARLVLNGRAAMLQTSYRDAEIAFRRAADLQEEKLGGLSDPPAWWYPVRRSVAAALLAEGKPQEAKAELTKAMVRWPYDPISLRLLAQADAAEGKPGDAGQDRKIASRNWFGDVDALPLALL